MGLLGTLRRSAKSEDSNVYYVDYDDEYAAPPAEPSPPPPPPRPAVTLPTPAMDAPITSVPISYDAFDTFEHGPESLVRGLTSAQLSMLAIGGAIGSGLVIDSGEALRQAGPLGTLISFTLIGWVCWVVMCSLGEMATLLPQKQGFAGFGTRFVDPAFGFMTDNYNYLFKYLIVTAQNITACGMVVRYWTEARDESIAVWLTVFVVSILLLNLLGVRFFGQAEYILSGIKVLTLVGLILMSLILTLGGNPQHRRVGFQYWKNPGPFACYKNSQQDNGGCEGGSALRSFAGFWLVLTHALFSYSGTELIGICIGESMDPRRSVPSAIKRTFWRIVLLYCGSVFVLGLVVASNDPGLYLKGKDEQLTLQISPFILAISNFGIGGLPHVVNALTLVFVLSASNSDLYIGSRTLYGLAAFKQAPRIFLRVNRLHSPYISVVFCWLFCFLSFMNVSESGPAVFKRLFNMSTLFGGLTWASILFSHIRFIRALEFKGRSRHDLPYTAPFGPWASWLSLAIITIVIIFKGFDAILSPFDVGGFVTSYIGIPIALALYLGYKWVYGTQFISSEFVDLTTGVREFDEDEKWFKEHDMQKGKSRWMRIWERVT